ncbi:MAG: hypothetical protein RLZ16_573, partial [Bacteroidota bacterium]
MKRNSAQLYLLKSSSPKNNPVFHALFIPLKLRPLVGGGGVFVIEASW